MTSGEVGALGNWLPLSIKGVEFGYTENPLFKGFALEIAKRGFYLLRPGHHVNAGTFLLRFLAGIAKPAKGEVYAGEKCLSDLSFEEFLPWTKKMGYVFESGGLLANKSLRDNILLPLMYHQPENPQQIQRRVDEAIRNFGLVEVQSERPADIHSRDYKIALLLRALISNPKVLFMVDPEESVDKERFKKFVREVEHRFEAGDLDLILYTSPTDFRFSKNHQYLVEFGQIQSQISEWAA